MRLTEAQGKAIFAAEGIAVPRGRLVRTPAEAAAAALGPVVVKAQVLAPGRGKAGGVVFAETPREARAAAAKLLGAALLGMTVETVLVEERLAIAEELYLAIALNALRGRIDVLMSRRGGADVEAAEGGAVRTVSSSSLTALEPYRAREQARELGLGGRPLLEFAGILHRAFALFRKADARLLENNPLVRTPDDRPIAADAILHIDDDAHFRQQRLEARGIVLGEERPRPPTAREIEAAKIDQADYRGAVHYVDLDPDGEVGVISVGSGFSITLVDLLRNAGLRPANFCDCSGNPPAAKVERAGRLILSMPQLQGFLVMSGVVSQPLDITAEGIVRAVAALRPTIPVVVLLAGNRDREAQALLKAHGIPEAYDKTTDFEFVIGRLKALMAEKEAVSRQLSAGSPEGGQAAPEGGATARSCEKPHPTGGCSES